MRAMSPRHFSPPFFPAIPSRHFLPPFAPAISPDFPWFPTPLVTPLLAHLSRAAALHAPICPPPFATPHATRLPHTVG